MLGVIRFLCDQAYRAFFQKYLYFNHFDSLYKLYDFWHELCIINVEKRNVMRKLNCWEVKKCGRELEGANIAELGVCPAATEQRLDGVHEGINAGRACWVIAGSMCGGKVQGTYAEKYANCTKCDFFMMVKSEENGSFKMTSTLIQNLQQLCF